MINHITSNPVFGILLTVIIYYLALRLYRKTGIQLLNPFLVSMTVIIAVLLLSDIPLTNYLEGGDWIVAGLPFTILLLALPLYRQLPLLLQHRKAIISGVLSGVITSILSVFFLGRLFGIDEALILSVIPKSITTPLGIISSEMIGGIAGITVIAIVFTGLLGVVIYIPVFKIFRITHPVAQGIAIGTTSHAIGTSKAMELGEIQGAMSGLAIVLSGIITIILAPVFLILSAFI